MTWQDVTIAVVQFSFTAAMMPVLFRWRRGLQLTSVMTAAGLTLIGVCFLTLHLWLSMAGVWSSAGAWWVLAWQERHSLKVRVTHEEAMAWGAKFEAMARHEEETMETTGQQWRAGVDGDGEPTICHWSEAEQDYDIVLWCAAEDREQYAEYLNAQQQRIEELQKDIAFIHEQHDEESARVYPEIFSQNARISALEAALREAEVKASLADQIARWIRRPEGSSVTMLERANADGGWDAWLANYDAVPEVI